MRQIPINQALWESCHDEFFASGKSQESAVLPRVWWLLWKTCYTGWIHQSTILFVIRISSTICHVLFWPILYISTKFVENRACIFLRNPDYRQTDRQTSPKTQPPWLPSHHCFATFTTKMWMKLPVYDTSVSGEEEEEVEGKWRGRNTIQAVRMEIKKWRKMKMREWEADLYCEMKRRTESEREEGTEEVKGGGRRGKVGRLVWMEEAHHQSTPVCIRKKKVSSSSVSARSCRIKTSQQIEKNEKLTFLCFTKKKKLSPQSQRKRSINGQSIKAKGEIW